VQDAHPVLLADRCRSNPPQLPLSITTAADRSPNDIGSADLRSSSIRSASSSIASPTTTGPSSSSSSSSSLRGGGRGGPTAAAAGRDGLWVCSGRGWGAGRGWARRCNRRPQSADAMRPARLTLQRTRHGLAASAPLAAGGSWAGTGEGEGAGKAAMQ